MPKYHLEKTLKKNGRLVEEPAVKQLADISYFRKIVQEPLRPVISPGPFGRANGSVSISLSP